MAIEIKGGFTTAFGGASKMAAEALGFTAKEYELSDQEKVLQEKIIKLIAEGKPDRMIRDETGCTDAKLQAIRMGLGKIIPDVRISISEKAVVTTDEGIKIVKEEIPKEIWDPFKTAEEKKTDDKKFKRIPTVWDPFSDKPPYVDVPIEDEIPEEIKENPAGEIVEAVIKVAVQVEIPEKEEDMEPVEEVADELPARKKDTDIVKDAITKKKPKKKKD